jgi:hypothetical protein
MMSVSTLCLLGCLTGTLALQGVPKTSLLTKERSLNGNPLDTATEYTSAFKSRMTMGGFARRLAENSKPVQVISAPTPMRIKRANSTNSTRKHHMGRHITWKNLTTPHTHHVCIPHKLAAGKAGRALQTKSLIARSNASAKAAPVYIAKPGAGVSQDLAAGVVNGEEVMKKAFKDGYSETGCYMDSMHVYFDKFGNNKDQYKGQHPNVSIVVYSEMVVKEDQVSMTPETCFDFCRTIPEMGFFGITNGDYCYCEPYFKPAESGSSNCDVPCVGDTSQMCGGKEKSTVFEMHLCNDAADDLLKAATAAGNALMNMYNDAWGVNWRSEGLTKSGGELQKLAGLGGDPVASDLGQWTKEKGGEMEHALWDGECFDAYKDLHKVYFDSEDVMDLDFFVASNLEKADTATADMTRLSKVVSACRDKALEQIVAMQPWYIEQQKSYSSDGRSWDREKANAWNTKIVDESRLSFQLYYPLGYAFNQGDPAARSMSTCGGEKIGMPKPLKLTECANACDRTVYPTKCVGYQHFAFGGSWKSGWHGPVCVLFSKFESLTLYPECSFMKKKQPRKWTERWSRTIRPGPGAECDKIALYVFQTGTTCERAFGRRSSVLNKCSEVCDKAKGTLVSATCDVSFAWLSGFKPDITVKENDGCFGGNENEFVDGHDEWPRYQPPDKGFGPHSMPSVWWPNSMWTDYYYYMQ